MDTVTRTDLDQLQAELEALRTEMLADRNAVVPKLDALVTKTRDLRENAMGGKFEPAVVCVHDILVTLSDGLKVQNRVSKMFDD